MRTGILTPENIVQFQPGEAEHVFLVIGVRQKLSKSSKYGARALSGCLEVLERLAKKGVIIKKLYGTSRTSDGIRIARGFGFREVAPPNNEDDLLRFELDFETTTSPLFKEYQQIVKRRRKRSSQ